MEEIFTWGKTFIDTLSAIGDFLFTPNDAFIEFVSSLDWLFDGLPVIGNLLGGFLESVATVPIAYLLTGSSLVVFLIIKLFIFFKSIIF